MPIRAVDGALDVEVPSRATANVTTQLAAVVSEIWQDSTAVTVTSWWAT